MRRLFLILAVFISGCVMGVRVNSTPDLNVIYPTHGRSKVDMVVMSESLEFGADFWAAEIERQYPGAVGVLCHGNDYGGVWSMFPDHFLISEDAKTIDDLFKPGAVTLVHDHPVSVQHEVEILQRRYPGRLIVLCVCNPQHHRLNMRGVVYAVDSVYVTPDRVQRKSEPDAVGNIYEFVHD